MGCSASSPAKSMPMNGSHQGQATLSSKEGRLHVEYAALVRPTKKDQDRYIALPHGSAGMVCGICDGHSVHANADGQRHAEMAARHLASDLWRRVRDKLSAAPGDAQPVAAPAALHEAATASFEAHQQKVMAVYQRLVVDRLVEEKAKVAQEMKLPNDQIPLELPQEGGTTATALVVHPEGLLACWVGDSRAIVAVEGGTAGEVVGGTMRVIGLTSDHNTYDEAERQRLLDAGGTTGKDGMAGHVFVKEAEGGLKVTRSLGDSPFHRGDAVSSKPGTCTLPLTSSSRFLVVASDGIWDHLSNVEVAEITSKAIGGGGAAGQSAAAAACAAILNHIEAGQKDGSLKPELVDDRSVLVLLFNKR